jgi:membrane protease subunit HflK
LFKKTLNYFTEYPSCNSVNINTVKGINKMSWDNDNNNNGPWGRGPRGGGNFDNNDLDKLLSTLRNSFGRFSSKTPDGKINKKNWLLFILIAIAIWGATGVYRVQPDEQGIVLRFGEYIRSTSDGLHYHLPFPIENVLKPKVTRENQVEVGIRTSSQSSIGRGAVGRDVPEESLMLTGDENIVDVDFSVQWVISDAADYLFNIQNQESTVKAVAESAMREVIGSSDLEQILTGGREKNEQAVRDLMQKTLDEYEAGILVRRVQLQKVDPPAAVIDAFRDVQAARADQERLRNEAEAYTNRIIPAARGESAQLIQAAEAYRDTVVADAEGQAARFNSVYEEYKKAPEVTRQRMYLETIERVYGGMDKIIIDQDGEGNNSGVVPYLPLDQLQKRQDSGENQ